MESTELESLAAEIEAAESLSPEQATWAVELLQPHLPERSGERIERTAFNDTDAVIHLVGRMLPDWTIILQGIARQPNGHWNCHLRQSEDRDNDEVIGSGKGPMLRFSLLAALLRVLAYRVAHASR